MTAGVTAIEDARRLEEALETLRRLVGACGLSWEHDALYLVEQALADRE